jgi:lactate dehydrogenase-like 2-hydroxyacid dehydrogenase
MFRILFTGNTFSKDELKELYIDGYEIIPADTDLKEDELIAKLKTVDAYIVGGKEIVNASVIKAASKNIKLISNLGIKTGTIDINAAKEFGVTVANTPKVSTYSVAEFTVGLLMTLNKNIFGFSQDTRAGIWKTKEVSDLKNKTVGIVGMGVIGRYTARILKNAFNMRILYSDICQKFEVEEELNATNVSLDDLCRESDFVLIHAALTDTNRSMIGNKELKQMKKSALLINTARAWLVNPDDLYIALKENWIAGAAFDGFYSEPIDRSKAGANLLQLPETKFIVTPHTGFNVYENDSKIKSMTIDNLKTVLNGVYCPNVVI